MAFDPINKERYEKGTSDNKLFTEIAAKKLVSRKSYVERKDLSSLLAVY